MNRFIELITMPQMQMSVVDKFELQCYSFVAVFIVAGLMVLIVRLRK